MMITSKFLLSVIRLNFVNVVNGKGKANAVNASPPCFMISRLVILLLIYMSFGKGSLNLIFLSNKCCSLSCNKHFSSFAIIFSLSMSCAINTLSFIGSPDCLLQRLSMCSLLWTKEAYLIRSLNGILHHHAPALSNREEPPACEKFSASFGREANQNKPLALIIPLGYSSFRYSQNLSG